MSLSDQFCGLEHAPLWNRELWCQRLKQQHRDLTDAELLKEWNDRMAQFYEDYGFIAGT